MKRSWFGLGLLVLLLVLALAVTVVMDLAQEQMCLSLAQSKESALLGQWEDVQFFLTHAEGQWEKHSHLRACFADQSALEDVEAALAALEVYRQSKDALSYRAACASLICRLEAIGEAHKPVWWNIL